MGRLNIDILYQMFKDGVVYRVTSDEGIQGGPYKTGGKPQDKTSIAIRKAEREKYAETERKQQQKTQTFIRPRREHLLHRFPQTDSRRLYWALRRLRPPIWGELSLI